MSKVFFSIFLFVLSSFSYAASWTPDLTVTKIFTEGKTDAVIIYTSGGSVYTTGCSLNNWSFSADSDARRGRAYSTAMAALASGKKIRLWYSDTCGLWSYHQATSIMLVK